MNIISEAYYDALITEIRDKNSDSQRIRDNLFALGQKVGTVIAGELLTEQREVRTPMNCRHVGLSFAKRRTVIVSTKDDYQYFANGIAGVIRDSARGYMDFDGVRGLRALVQPVRSISLPVVNNVNCVIIAKSVLATGCTAISLTKKSIEQYNPRHVVIATVFYSEDGVYELLDSIATAEIYAYSEPDSLDPDGMLIPGIGNLDERLNH